MRMKGRAYAVFSGPVVAHASVTYGVQKSPRFSRTCPAPSLLIHVDTEPAAASLDDPPRENLVFHYLFGDFWSGGRTWALRVSRTSNTDSYCLTIIRQLLKNNTCSMMVSWWFVALHMCAVLRCIFVVSYHSCLPVLVITEMQGHDSFASH